MLKFGKKHVFPLVDSMKKLGVPLETKELRAVLKKARDDKFLLPSQYRLARSYAHVLLKEYLRIDKNPLSSSKVY